MTIYYSSNFTQRSKFKCTCANKKNGIVEKYVEERKICLKKKKKTKTILKLIFLKLFLGINYK